MPGVPVLTNVIHGLPALDNQQYLPLADRTTAEAAQPKPRHCSAARPGHQNMEHLWQWLCWFRSTYPGEWPLQLVTVVELTSVSVG